MPQLHQTGTRFRFAEFTALLSRNFSVAAGFIHMQDAYGKHEVDEERMKIRKSWTRVFAITLLSAAAVWWVGTLAAQEPSAAPHPSQEGTAPTGKTAHGDAVEMRLERLSQQLNLTDEQKAKIRPVLRHEIERIMQVRSNTSLSQGETQRRIKLIHGDTHQRIGEFLTPEQKKGWQEARHQQRGTPEGAEHSPQSGRAPDAPPAPPNSN